MRTTTVLFYFCRVKKLLLLLCLSLPLLASAQIVRVEMTPDPNDTTRLNGEVNLNGSIVQNSRQLFRLAAGSRLKYRKLGTRQAYLSLNDLRLTFSDNKKLENRGFQHVRHQLMIDTAFTWETFGQIQFDHLLRIQLRTLTGTGPRFSFGKKWMGKLHLGTLYMWEYEEELGNGVINRAHRGSIYVNWTRPLGEAASLELIGYYQPNLTMISDYRLLANSTFALRVSKRLRFRFSADIVYDTAPAADARDLSYTLVNGLAWEF